MHRLLDGSGPDAASSEEQVSAVVTVLRSRLRKRADRRLYRASPRDPPDLRRDSRIVLSGVSHSGSGIASGDLVEAYVGGDTIDAVADEHLLSPATVDRNANVVMQVVTASTIGDICPLVLAADLAEHRRPREEARAAELLRQIAAQHPEFVA